MHNQAFQRALLALAHPVSIGALIVLLLNDHVWRRVWPSWFTGKIGDFTWLIFAPFLLAAILAWLVPPRLPRRDERVAQLAIVITGLVFGLAKTVPAFHALTIWGLETLTGWPSALRLDPTDLLALPALLITWRVWKHGESRRLALPSRGWVLLPLAALATIANSPAPYFGIECFQQADSSIVTGPSSFLSFTSRDGGLTWQEEDSEIQFTCDKPESVWYLADPVDERIQYRFTRGVSIERSEDGGLTWRTEFNLAGDEARQAYIHISGRSYYPSPVGPLDAVIHQPTGNVVAAMGHEGVVVRTSDGAWRWVAVGDLTVPELNRSEAVASLLAGESWLALGLAGLAMGTITRRAGNVDLGGLFLAAVFTISLATPVLAFSGIIYPDALLVLVALAAAGLTGAGLVVRARTRRVPFRVLISRLFLVWAWAAWLATLILFSPALAGAIAAIVLALPAALGQARRAYRARPIALAKIAVVAAIVAAVFLIPFVIWSQGGIPRYSTAVMISLVLAGAALAGGMVYVRRSGVVAAIEQAEGMMSHA